VYFCEPADVRLPLLSYVYVTPLIVVGACGLALPVPAYVYEPTSDLFVRSPTELYVYVCENAVELAAVVGPPPRH
jgi:hypothetical protein